jgi:hypothetical protein
LKVVTLFFTLLVAFYFQGCSSKKVFEPEVVQGDWKFYGEDNASIIDISSEAALLENRKVLLKEKYLDVAIQEGYRVVGYSDGWVISANMDGNMTLTFSADASLQESFNLKKTVAAASVEGDILAVLFRDNEMELYSIATKELLFKEQGSAPIIVDSRIVNPYFMNDLVLFLTLDGKIVIVNTKLKKKLRTIIVSSEQYFNNIVFFTILENKLVAATAYKMLSMGEKEIRVPYEVRNIAYDTTTIYITTKQGEVVALDTTLQERAKLKFPFAHFLGMIVHNEKIYVLEKEGYLIEIDKDFKNHTIYEVDLADGYVFVGDTLFYVDDTSISVE